MLATMQFRSSAFLCLAALLQGGQVQAFKNKIVNSDLLSGQIPTPTLMEEKGGGAETVMDSVSMLREGFSQGMITARYEEYMRVRREMNGGFCYDIPSTENASKLYAEPIHTQYDFEVKILTSRPHVVNASLHSWMRHLVPSVQITLVVDQKAYMQNKSAWDALPFAIQTYTTSDNKAPYIRGAEVFLSAVQHTASLARRGDFKAKWAMFVDDDSWMDFGHIYNVFLQKNHMMPKIWAKGGPGNICGGFGVTFSHRALQLVNPNRMTPCGEHKWGDAALSGMLGLGRNGSGAVFNDKNIYGYDNDGHPEAWNCETTCVIPVPRLYGENMSASVQHNCLEDCLRKQEDIHGMSFKPSSAWKPSGNSVNANQVC